jgi:hypothetical protein
MSTSEENSAAEKPAGAFGPQWKIVLRAALACAASAAVIVIASVILMAGALVFSDNAKIQANLRDAATKGLITAKGSSYSPYGDRDHSYDLATDCVGFMVNLWNDDDPILRRVAETPTRKLEYNGCALLIDGLNDEAVVQSDPYIRYWHGYQVYLRPLLTIMPLESVRRMAAALLYGVMIFLSWRMARWFGPLAWPVFLLPFILISDFLTVPMVVTHALQLVFVFLSAAVVPVVMDRAPNARALALPVCVFAAGMISSFFSFLMNPPLAAALIGFLAIANNPGRTPRETGANLLYAAGLIALWFAGYFGEWIAKGVFAALVLGVDPVIKDIMARADVYGEYAINREIGFLDATKLNIYQHGAQGLDLSHLHRFRRGPGCDGGDATPDGAGVRRLRRDAGASGDDRDLDGGERLPLHHPLRLHQPEFRALHHRPAARDDPDMAQRVQACGRRQTRSERVAPAYPPFAAYRLGFRPALKRCQLRT